MPSTVKTVNPFVDITDNLSDSNHDKTQYQVSKDSAFNNVIYDSGEIDDLQSHQIPKGNLNKGNTYYARSRIKTNGNLWSPWSSGFEFDVIQQTNILNSFSTPGNIPWGVVINSSGNLISTSFNESTNQAKIHIHDGISATTTSNFDISYASTGITIDSSGNLIGIDSGSLNSKGTINVHSGISSTITNNFSTPDSTSIGLIIDSNDNLISSDSGTDKIYVHQGISSTITTSFSSPGNLPTGLTIDSNGNLISIDGGKIHIHDGISSTTKSNFDIPDLGVFNPALGLTIDSNGNLILVGRDNNNGSGKIFIIELL